MNLGTVRSAYQMSTDDARTYINSYPYQNVFTSKQECDNVRISLPAAEIERYVERTCREIGYEIVNLDPTSNATSSSKYFTTDTRAKDLMAEDNREFHELDIRRIEAWFEGCLMPPDNEPPPEEHCKSGAE